jgi:arsenate reductase-like glutaredoxin family protein
MQAGIAIISRNMAKTPPALKVPTIVIEDGVMRFDYTQGGMESMGMDTETGMPAGMPAGMRPGMPPPMMGGIPANPSGMPGSSANGTSGTATMIPLEQMQMKVEEIKNKAPYEWLDRVYKVATRHIEDSAKLMENVLTANSGRVIGTDIRNERVDKEFFKTVINTSEEGLTAYISAMTSDEEMRNLMEQKDRITKNDVKKLLEQKDRVRRSLGAYQRQLTRMSKTASDAFTKASTGVDPNASASTTSGPGSGLGGGTGSGTARPAVNPLGGQL